MEEARLSDLHRRFADLAYEYEIELLGHDGLVAFADFRLMDIEHIIHELAHCTLWGFDIDTPECMKKLDGLGEKPEHQLQLNEIEAFSVTMEVMRRLGVHIVVEDFTASLEIAAYGFETPVGLVGHGGGLAWRRNNAWIVGFLSDFVKSPRGSAAVYRLLTRIGEA